MHQVPNCWEAKHRCAPQATHIASEGFVLCHCAAALSFTAPVPTDLPFHQHEACGRRTHASAEKRSKAGLGPRLKAFSVITDAMRPGDRQSDCLSDCLSVSAGRRKFALLTVLVVLAGSHPPGSRVRSLLSCESS